MSGLKSRRSQKMCEKITEIYGKRQMALVFFGGLLFWGWIEILAFIFVSNVIGGLLTLLGVFLTAIVGITF